MKTKNETIVVTHQTVPVHSAAVERVAREILIWSAVAAGICTIIVMLVKV